MNITFDLDNFKGYFKLTIFLLLKKLLIKIFHFLFFVQVVLVSVVFIFSFGSFLFLLICTLTKFNTETE
jgi:hypothetical protein